MSLEEDIKSILILFNSNKIVEAKKEIDKKIIKNPNSFVLYNILGAILAKESKLEDAVENYKRSIKINPNYAEAYNNLGVSFHELNKLDEAIKSYKKAINLKPNFAEAFNNLGNTICEINNSKESLEYFEKALEIKPNYAEAYFSLARAYEKQNQKQQAIDNFKKAILLKKNYAEAYNGLGLVYNDISNSDAAYSNFNKAIAANPNYEKTYNNLGNLLSGLGKHDEATKMYQSAIKIKSNYASAYSNLLFNLNYKINFEIDFYLEVAKQYRLNCKSELKNLSFKYQYEKNPKKLKIGFVSADFGNHPGGYFTLSTLRELKNKNFDLIAYSTTNRPEKYSDYFKPLFSKWNYVEKKNDEEIIKQILEDGIHILIDLQGHSAKNRLTVFMHEAAPVQATWLGQGSTGIPEIKYFIGNSYINPKLEDQNYVEKVLRLPDVSQCFTIPEFDIKIEELPALKNNFITFGGINKITKINGEVIKLWSRILLSTPNSKLLLANKALNDKSILENLYKRFKINNISEDRLILLGETKTRKDLLALYNKIDITLDPFPYQGNTSTLESLWMGVPVVVLKGNRYLFHFGESINNYINMNNWVAKNKEEYISKTIKFASDINYLIDLRKNLRDNFLNSSLCNAVKFSNNFNNLLWNMWNNFKENNLTKNKP